jgi:hypothetical protein
MKAFRVNLEKDGRNQHQARITVVLDEDNSSRDIEVLSVKEDESMCDGLGGGTWDGSLLLMDLVQEWLAPRGAPSSSRTPYESSTSGMGARGSSSEARSDESNPYIVELGAGTGLLGIAANAVNQSVDVCVTDRYSDLLEDNVRGVLCPSSIGNMKRGKERYRSVAEAMRKQAFLGTVAASADSSGDAKACTKTDQRLGLDLNPNMNDASIASSPKRNRQQRSPEGKDGEDNSSSPSEERPRKRNNSVAADAKEGSSSGSDTSSNGSGRGNLTFEELTWTVKDASTSGFKPAPTAEEIRILFTPLPGHTYVFCYTIVLPSFLVHGLLSIYCCLPALYDTT